MAFQKYKTARAVAIMVLSQFDPKHNYASPILNKLLDETDEKQRATDLVYGTIRNRFAIDTVIATFSGRPVHRISSKLLNIIRVAVFELVYSPATPEYSIVNEAVENVKAIDGKKQTSFVNAVLRQITRHISNRQIHLSKADPEAALPQTPLTGCEFDSCFLPDPKVSLADYLSIAFSLPKWLITDWLGEFGEDPTRQICFASNRRPSIYIRPNTLKTTAKELAAMFHQADIDCEIVPDVIPAEAGIQKDNDMEDVDSRLRGNDIKSNNDKANKPMVRIKSPRAVMELPGFAEGLFTVQDVSAAKAVKILDPQPGWTILDLCAAPGTKTTQLAEATGDLATIIATDIDSQRLKMVEENIARLGIKSVNIILYEQIEHKAAEIGLFDAILLDVPCSNTGVLAKRIEARYRLKPKAIKEMTKTQAELLAKAATIIKPGGKICYSTCSIQRCENSELIKDFPPRGFKLESEKFILPSAPASSCLAPASPDARRGSGRRQERGLDHDGGYIAILTRK